MRDILIVDRDRILDRIGQRAQPGSQDDADLGLDARGVPDDGGSFFEVVAGEEWCPCLGPWVRLVVGLAQVITCDLGVDLGRGDVRVA